MKKLLLGTTALVGASFAATAAMAAPEVRIGGYLDFQAGFSSQDIDNFGPAPGVPTVTTGERGFGFLTDTELLVRASDKLDNGLAWSVKIELEADADTVNPGSNDNADEVSIVFSGSWGQLTLGNEDGPVDAKNYIGEGQITGIGVSGARGYRRWTNTTSFSNGLEVAGVDPNNTSDATKIMYYTPTIAGFQFGVSYSADSADNGASRNSDTAFDPNGTAVGTFENWFELGASYDVKVSDDFALGFATAMSIADAENTATQDIKAWLISAKAEFAGFTASIGYSDSGDSGQVKALANTDVSNYAAALKYTTGPYQVGVSYAHAMAGANAGNAGLVSNTADYTADTFTIGAQYTLGAGLVVYADTWYYTNDSDGVRASSENSAIGLMIGTRATF
jgi:outer membrane protein OmpU